MRVTLGGTSGSHPGRASNLCFSGRWEHVNCARGTFATRVAELFVVSREIASSRRIDAEARMSVVHIVVDTCVGPSNNIPVLPASEQGEVKFGASCRLGSAMARHVVPVDRASWSRSGSVWRRASAASLSTRESRGCAGLHERSD